MCIYLYKGYIHEYRKVICVDTKDMQKLYNHKDIYLYRYEEYICVYKNEGYIPIYIKDTSVYIEHIQKLYKHKDMCVNIKNIYTHIKDI